jgi:hypothetical protein
MKTPLIEGLSQGMLESYLKERLYDALYYPNFFPIKDVNRLDAKTLIGSVGSRVIGHVISYNVKAPEAGRKSVQTMHFDIPKTAQSRVKDEKEILEWHIARAIQGNNAVIEDLFNDTDFVYDSCEARKEWFALQALSLTKIQLAVANNPQGIVNETVIDFGMADANKKTVSVIWSTANAANGTMDPMADFKAVVKAARAKGITFARILMTSDTYDLVVAATKFQTYFTNSSSIVTPMTLQTINSVIGAYNIPPITLIDTSVGIEGKDGTVTAVNPWSTTHVTFLPDLKCGNMLNGPIAEELERPPDVIQAKRGSVLISVKKDFNPVKVITKGECNVFPSWVNIDRCYSLYTAHASTWA